MPVDTTDVNTCDIFADRTSHRSAHGFQPSNVTADTYPSCVINRRGGGLRLVRKVIFQEILLCEISFLT